jgi:pimeloyl-ACP methyl ester carboxylesterase
MSKPTIVIVPGAWQLPSVWDFVIQALHKEGYESVLVPLPTVGGTELPLAELSDDVAAVQAALTKLVKEDKKILILSHSGGGLVASNAVVGFELSVVGIIYMTAFMIPAGKALFDMLGGKPLPWMIIEVSISSITIFQMHAAANMCTPAQSDRVLGNLDMVAQVGFNDLSEEDQAKWSKEMSHTSASMFTTPSSYEPWAKGVRCAFIFCSQDNAIPYPIQQQMAAQLGPDPVTVTLKSGHCPHLSMPDKLVEAIKTIEARLV